MGRRRGPNTDPSSISGQTGADIGGSGGAEVSKNPLRNVYPEDYRVGSEFQSNGGTFTNLKSLPHEVGNNGVVKDPQDELSLVSIGGVDDDSGSFTNDTQTYSTRFDSWDVEKYPSPREAIEDFTDTTVQYDEMGCCTVDDNIVVAGGKHNGGFGDRHSLDGIYTLDTSEASPSWTALNSTLSVPAKGYPAVEPHDGEVYVIGGSDGDDTLDNAYRVDVINDTISNISSPPIPITDTSSTIADGEIYISGHDGDTGKLFLKYTIETDSWTQLADVEGLDGDSETGWGCMKEYGGNIFLIDGYFWHDTNDITIYSIEDDKWEGRPSPTPGEMGPWTGSNRGVIINGVIYMAGTGNHSENLWAYIPEKEPFEE